MKNNQSSAKKPQAQDGQDLAAKELNRSFQMAQESSPDQLPQPLINIQFSGMTMKQPKKTSMFQASVLFPTKAMQETLQREMRESPQNIFIDSIHTYPIQQDSESVFGRTGDNSPQGGGISPVSHMDLVPKMSIINGQLNQSTMPGRNGSPKDQQNSIKHQMENGNKEFKLSVIPNPLNLDKVLRVQMNDNQFSSSFNQKQQQQMNSLSQVPAQSSPHRRKQIEKAPPMSTRRRLMNAQTAQQQEIEERIIELSNSSETQPIFMAIWKVVLTLCFEREALRNYMRKGNLIRVPIRALHYQEILCLFRKAHGPILQVQKIDDADKQKVSQQKKKAQTTTAGDTVQGFVSYKIFCLDIIRMLGDGVLLVRPQIYSLIVQLLFEAISIQTTIADGEDVIYIKRITDIKSPLENQVTDNLPVNKIFRVQTLSTIVKYFCMQQISEEEIKRLVERRFIPNQLTLKTVTNKPAVASTGVTDVPQQQFDCVEKVMQHFSWKEHRIENDTKLALSKSPRFKDSKNTIQKITHKQGTVARIVDVPTSSSHQLGNYSPNKLQVSEMSSEDGKQNNNTLIPKLAADRQTPQTINQLSPTLRNRLSDLDNNPRIDGVSPCGVSSNQFHVKVEGQVPRTPQSNQRRSVAAPYNGSINQSRMTSTNQTMDLSPREGPNSFQNNFSRTRPVTNEANKRNNKNALLSNFGMKNGVASVPKQDLVLSDQQIASAAAKLAATNNDPALQEDQNGAPDQPSALRLMDQMQMSQKYRKMNMKNKMLEETAEINEIRQFQIQKAMFEKMRKTAMDDQKASDGIRNESSDGMDGPFNVKINSHGKLDEQAEEDKQKFLPIDEMGEIINELGQKLNEDQKNIANGDLAATLKLDLKQTQEELFDFKSLLNQSYKTQQQEMDQNMKQYREHQQQFNDGGNSCMTSNSPISPMSPFFQNAKIKSFEDHHQTVEHPFEKEQNGKKYQQLNVSRKFNRQSLQKQSQKNKLLIASNMRLYNEMRQSKGYNANLQTGKRYDPKENNKKKVHHLTNFVIPRLDEHQTIDMMMQLNTFSPSVTMSPSSPMSTNREFNNTADNSFQAPSFFQTTRAPTEVSGGFVQQQTTLDSSQITNLQIGSRQPTTSSRRKSHYKNYQNPSQVGSSSSHQRPRFGIVGSPDSFGSRGKRNSTFAHSQHEDPSLDQAINCQTIPKLVLDIQARLNEKGVGTDTSKSGIVFNGASKNQQEVLNMTIQHQMRNANPIPIHLHLAQAKLRNEFSPFSLNGTDGVKDSLNIKARQSRQHSKNSKRENQFELSRGYGIDDGICTMRAESHLEANNILHSYLLKKNSTGQKSMHNQNSANNTKYAGKTGSSLNNNQTSTKIVLVAPRMSQNQVTNKISLVNVKDGSGKEITTSGNRGARVVNTADHQSRNKVAGKLQNESGRGESFGDMPKSSVKISKLLEETKDAASKQKNEDLMGQMNMDDLNRWNASLENSVGMLFDGSGEPLKSKDPNDTNSDEEKFELSKHRDEMEIEFQVSGPKPQTSNPDKRSLFQEKQEIAFYQKGEFVAPRRNHNKKYRSKTKAPLNFLAMQDYKGTRNLKISMINPDLITSRNETETDKLSQSIKTPVNRNRKISIQGPRVGFPKSRHSPNQSMMRENGRTPTPIKIVDLSANPLVNQVGTIQEDYVRHFPLLNNRTQPLKQETLRLMNLTNQNKDVLNDRALQNVFDTSNFAQKIGKISVLPTEEYGIKRATTIVDRVVTKIQRGVFDAKDDIDLKQKVSYMVSSPIQQQQSPGKNLGQSFAMPHIMRSTIKR